MKSNLYPVEDLVGPFVCCDHHAEAVESECQRRMAERKNLLLSDKNWELQNKVNWLEEELEGLREQVESLLALDVEKDQDEV